MLAIRSDAHRESETLKLSGDDANALQAVRGDIIDLIDGVR